MGGCGEFGMNLTAYLHRGRLMVVDCGVRFPDLTKLGVDAVIPDVEPWFKAVGGVYAYYLTHAHEDHVGAIPHIVKRWPAPIYATAWTAALLKHKFTKLGVDPAKYPVTIVEPGDRIASGGFEVEYVHVNHSIPQSCALFIRTPGATVFHTGDFKYEPKTTVEPPMDFERLQRLGDEGVDLLLADSTNAEKPGLSPAEASVYGPLRDTFAASKGAVVITTFSSNLWRLKNIAEAAQAVGRRIYVAGAGMDFTLATGEQLGLYKMPKGLRVPEAEIGQWPREKLVIMASGCQGEGRAGLARIASGEHKAFKLAAGDTVVLSSRIIPGNEKAIAYVLDGCKRQGALIVTAREAPGIHVTGHAHSGELRLLAQALRPRFYCPVHGAYGQLAANLEQATRAGHPEVRARLIETGDVLDVSQARGVEHMGDIAVELSYVDAESHVVLTHTELKERLKIGDLGLLIASGVYLVNESRWLVEPDVEWVGIRPPDAATGTRLNAAMKETLREKLPQLLGPGRLGTDEAREELRILLRRQLAAVLKKKPVVNVKLQIA